MPTAADVGALDDGAVRSIASGYAADAQAAAIAAAATDATTKADAKVADAINDGTTTVAPSQNAVFDALAVKAPIAALGDLNPVWPSVADGVGVYVGGDSASLLSTVAVASPVTLLAACTVSQVRIWVNAGGGTGALARIAIYAAGADRRPGALIYDCGTVPIQSTGIKTATLAVPQSLPAGVYFIATSLDTGVTATIYGLAGGTAGSSIGNRGPIPDNVRRVGSYYFTTTGGAMTSSPAWLRSLSIGAVAANFGLTIASVP